MIDFLSNIILCGLCFLFGACWMRENYIQYINKLHDEIETLKRG